jgi:predicted nucleotidyltransferase
MAAYRLDRTVRNQAEIHDALCALAQEYGLAVVYAFGSRAAEVAARVAGEDVEADHPLSDVDIGVLPGRAFLVEERVGLMQALEDLFGVARVDLVILPEAPPYLALDVVRGELLYIADVDVEAEYQLYVLRRAGDLAPFERARLRMILAGEAI